MNFVKDITVVDPCRGCTLKAFLVASAFFLLLGCILDGEKACAQRTGNPTREGAERADFQFAREKQNVQASVSPDKALELANEHIDAGRFRAALDLLEPYTSHPLRYPKIVSDYLAVLVWTHQYEKALHYFETLPHSFPKRDYLIDLMAKAKETWISSLAPRKGQELLRSEKCAVGGKEQAKQERLLVLAISGKFEQAVQAFEDMDINPEACSDHLLGWIAWSYFKMGRVDTSLEYFQILRSRDSANLRAGTGIAYCLAAEGKTESALSLLDRLSKEYSRNAEIHFARAYVYEQAGFFWKAVGEYDRILALQPGNQTAKRLRLLALSDLGANSYALEQACSDLPEAYDLEKSLRKRSAVDRLHWKEPLKGLAIMEDLVREDEWLELEYDLVVARVEAKQMSEALVTYESLLQQEKTLPWWVHQSAGKAYLYLVRPEEALQSYRKALEKNPDSFESRMGLFYSFQELRRWEEARAVLEELDRDVPPLRILPAYKGRPQAQQPNWPELRIALAKGWFELYQDRLERGQKQFEKLYSKAPANPGIRNGLAHSYLWRGWPRRALREFQIIDSIAPDAFYKHEIGRLQALNQLAEKKQARSGARELLAAHPDDIRVQRLVRDFELEDMFEWHTDLWVSVEDDGPRERGVRSSLSKRIKPCVRLTSFALWQETEDRDLQSFWRRTGLGIDWIINRSLGFKQQFSMDYTGAEDFGSLSEIRITPNDYLSFRGTYDTFSIDVPARARVFDIEADSAAIDFTFRESDRRILNLILSRLDFSDSNVRESASMKINQAVYAMGDWMVRCYAGLSASRNSRSDAPYFNPDNDWSLSVTPMLQQTVHATIERSFLHRLFFSLGLYKQSGFSADALGGLRYELEYRFTRTTGLHGWVAWDRSVYDGEPVNSFSMSLGLNWRL